MKNLNNWLDRPWTNRTYLKWCCVGAIIGATLNAIYMAWFYRDEIVKRLNNRYGFFEKKVIKEEDP